MTMVATCALLSLCQYGANSPIGSSFREYYKCVGGGDQWGVRSYYNCGVSRVSFILLLMSIFIDNLIYRYTSIT